MSAAFTPRVRTMLICEEVIFSDIEYGVASLEGVRQQLQSSSFPFAVDLSLFLVMSSPRTGHFPGRATIEHVVSGKRIRYKKFTAEFEDDDNFLCLGVEFGRCRFSAPGEYTIEVSFFTTDGQDVLKAEQRFHVRQLED